MNVFRHICIFIHICFKFLSSRQDFLHIFSLQSQLFIYFPAKIHYEVRKRKKSKLGNAKHLFPSHIGCADCYGNSQRNLERTEGWNFGFICFNCLPFSLSILLTTFCVFSLVFLSLSSPSSTIQASPGFL